MKQYLVITKSKSYLIDAECFNIADITDGRRSVYKFFKNINSESKLLRFMSAELVAAFDSREVKAVIEQ